ncbi:MAG: radical SAM protein [Candidatus Bathyarchaeia archaeon]
MWGLIRPDALAVLRDERCRRSLHRYFQILEDKLPAQFLLARKTPASKSDDPWEAHRTALKRFLSLKAGVDSGRINFRELPEPEYSLFDLKIDLAWHLLRGCRLCERKCGVDRLNGELGYCRCGTEVAVSTSFPHLGEEPELVPSGTIFTCGCTMRCIHCQNWTISQWFEDGVSCSPERLSRIIEGLKEEGCRNINLVGGDPTSWLPQWLKAFKYVKLNVPVVWNSNSYYSEYASELLKGFADIYLLDFKYGPGECAKEISDAPKYWEAAKRNHLEAHKFGELIIRILVLPGHLECCYQHIIRWISDNLPRETRVNVMFQYRPEWRARGRPELSRTLTSQERSKAIQIAKENGLTNLVKE